jgi:hypothetical protein
MTDGPIVRAAAARLLGLAGLCAEAEAQVRDDDFAGRTSATRSRPSPRTGPG